jgi:hypothetical protein
MYFKVKPSYNEVMSLNKTIPFTLASDVVRLLPTRTHCAKGPDASASISMEEILAIDMGVRKTVEVWDQIQRRMYIFDAKTIVPKLYQCGSSDFMAFKYKQISQIEE